MSEPAITFDITKARSELVSRLGAFRRSARWHIAMGGVARLVLEAAGLAMLSYILDRTFRLGFGLRITLLLLAIALLAYEAWRFIVSPLLHRIGFVELADALDRAAPGRATPSGFMALAPRVATVLELDSHPPGIAPPSSAMVRSAISEASRALANIKWNDRLDASRFKLHVGAIAGVLVMLMLIAALFPAMTGLWAKRWFAGSNDPWPQKTYLSVVGLTEDGRLLVPRGEASTLLVRVRSGSVEPAAVTLRMRPAGGKRVDAAMTHFGPSDFRHDLPPVQNPMTLEAEGGDEYLGPITVEPIDRPRIEHLELFSQHPTESAAVKHEFNGDDSDLTFLPQTALRLVVRSNVPLSHLSLGEAEAMGVIVRDLPERMYEITWKHQQAMHFQIELTGRGTNLTSLATPLTVGLLTDQPPRVSLTYAGVRQRITPQATIPLTLLARDDYGVSSMTLASHCEFLDADQKRQTSDAQAPLFGPQKPAIEKEVQLPNRFTVASLHAPVGALVSVSAVANDDRYEGSQSGKSKEASFRIVAPEELFREILLRQQGERAKLRKVNDQAAAIRQLLAILASADAAGGLGRQHRALQREVTRIRTSLADSLTEMQLNALGGQESYDLMNRNVLEPLKQLDDGLLTQQRDALDALAGGGATDSAAAVARQDEIINQINAILKQMAQWDSFVDVLNQLNEIIHLQEQAKQTTEELKTKAAESVFDK